MVVVDLGEFSSDTFDPKRWINSALDSRHPQDPLDRYLSDLEENLRSAAETIADALERESADAVRRVPVAVRDVIRLRDEAARLRGVVSGILLKLKKVCTCVRGVICLPFPSWIRIWCGWLLGFYAD